MKKEKITQHIFLAGYKACENGWNLQKAENWFNKTYSTELSEVREPVTDKMIEDYIEENTDMYSLDNHEQDDIRKAIKWVLSLKTQFQSAQSPLTDKQIEKWANYQSLTESEDEDGKIIEIETPLAEYYYEGAKAYRDGKIAEWLKQKK